MSGWKCCAALAKGETISGFSGQVCISACDSPLIEFAIVASYTENFHKKNRAQLDQEIIEQEDNAPLYIPQFRGNIVYASCRFETYSVFHW